MRYFYAPPDQISLENKKILLSQDEREHIVQVLRLKSGDEICVLDGLGKKYYSTIVNINSDRLIAHIDFVKQDRLRKLKLHLFQSLPKPDKFELIVQKATELGVHSINPFLGNRSRSKLDKDKVSDPQKRLDRLDRLDRWKKISTEAAKQSGNSTFPKLCGILSFQEMLYAIKDLNCEMNLILWEAEPQNSIKSIIQNVVEMSRRGVSNVNQINQINQAAVIIGPEAGFEEEEVRQARTFGAIPVSLGEKILRTETAAIATCVIILYEFEELCPQQLL